MTMKVGGVEFDITVDANGVTTATTKAVGDLEKLQAKLKATDPAAKRAGDSLGNMGRKAGAAGIQVQQLVGQIQGGQNVFNALSAQAADLGIVLGAPLVGAVAGLGAAFAGILLPSLFNTEDKTQDLIDKLRELSETQILSKEQAALLAQEERNLINEKKELVKAAEDEIKEQNRLIQVMRDSMARNQGSQIAYKNYQKSIKEANEEIVRQQALLKTTNDELAESEVKLNYYQSAMAGGVKQTKEQAKELENLVQAIEAQAEAIGKTDRQLAIKAATEKNATEAQLEAINAAFDAIEADEARAKSVIESAKAEREAIKMRMEAQKNYESLLDEIFANQKKKEEEDAQKKQDIGSNLDKIRENLMTEQQLRADAFILQGEQLREALEAELLTKQEFDALDRERVMQHQQFLIDANREAAMERVKAEKDAQNAINALQRASVNNAIGFLDQFASESKAAAIAAIALSKGLAIAQTIQNTGVAVMKAMSVDPTGVLAARAKALGALNVAMIAATGLAQAGSALSGGGNPRTSSGGVPAFNTTGGRGSDTGAVNQRNISIALTGSGFSGGDIRGLISAINEELGDGVNLSATGG